MTNHAEKAAIRVIRKLAKKGSCANSYGECESDRRCEYKSTYVRCIDCKEQEKVIAAEINSTCESRLGEVLDALGPFGECPYAIDPNSCGPKDTVDDIMNRKPLRPCGKCNHCKAREILKRNGR